jgi:hypothetical protein
MARLTAEQRRDLMEVVDDRHQRASTILATQIPIEDIGDFVTRHAGPTCEADPSGLASLGRPGALLSGATLRRSDGATLRRADLGDASLWQADLAGACLDEVEFQEAKLDHADFRGADLRGAGLRSGARMLKELTCTKRLVSFPEQLSVLRR